MRGRRTSKGRTGIREGTEDDGGMKRGDNDKEKKKILLDPKAPVLEMLKDPKYQQEQNKKKEKLSRIKLELNREIWTNDMLGRVRKEKVPDEHWGDVQGGTSKV